MENPSLEQVIGQNVAKHRKRHGWNQSDLGALMGEQLGKPWQRQRVWAVENGKSTFGAADLCALSAVLSVTVSDLLSASDPVQVGDVLWSVDRLTAAVDGVPNESDANILNAAKSLRAVDRVRGAIFTLTQQQYILLDDAKNALRGVEPAELPEGEKPHEIAARLMMDDARAWYDKGYTELQDLLDTEARANEGVGEDGE